jgi:hypothetical protein
MQPNSWDGLKQAMHDRFVPASYMCDLCKKLQRLEQGDMSVQEYYAELQKGMVHCRVVEDAEDKVCRFYGGLQHKSRILLTIKNLLLLINCSNLLCLQKKNCRDDSSNNNGAWAPTTTLPRPNPSCCHHLGCRVPLLRRHQ